MADVEIRKIINGPEGFTPDNEFCLGPTDVEGFWVAAGFCAHGIAGAGAVGRVMADWLLDGDPGMDLWEMDVRRFGRQYRSPSYTLARVTENYETYYDIKYPGHERRSGRPLRMSPAYPAHREAEAEFGEKSGWERVNYYWSNEPAGDDSRRPLGWAGKLWSPAIEAEHRATREHAGLFDETSFGKLEVSGPGAADLLERLCDNTVARGPGRIVYTQMLNARGGIECDVTVTQIDTETFQIVTGTAFAGHDLAWIRRHAPRDGSVLLRDVTSARTCFGLWGPAAQGHPAAADAAAAGLRVVPVPDDARDDGGVGAGAHVPGDVRGRARLGAVRADGVRRAVVGRAGRGGRAARDAPVRLQGDRLAAGGEGLPLLGLGRHAGRHAVRRRARASACGWTRRTSSAARRWRRPVRRRPGGWRASPSRTRGGRCSGTSRYAWPGRRSAGSPAVRWATGSGSSIAFAYLPADLVLPGTAAEVLVFGEWVAATVAAEPLFDPKGERIRA